MPGELTNVWAKSGAKPESLSACQTLLSPVVAMQGGTAATQLPDQSLWNTGTREPLLCPALGWAPGVGRGEEMEMQELHLRVLKGCLGFIPTPSL